MKNPEARERIAEHLETALARALSSMAGREFSILREKQEMAEPLEEPIVWEQSFSFDPQTPSLWIVAGKDLWTAVGRLTLAAVGIDDASDEDCRSTWQEIAGQTIGG